MDLTTKNKTMSNYDQLTLPSEFDADNVIFSDPVTTNIPDSKLTFKRIFISIKNQDGSIGSFCMQTDLLYSFGPSPDLDEKNKDIVNGWKIPLCMYDKNGATPSQKTFVDVINNFVEKCKDHLLEIKDDIDQYSLERSDLKKFGQNCLYYKRDPKNKAKILDGVGPTLYAKLLYNKKKNEIMTEFFDNKTGRQIDPQDLVEKHCYATACIKFESIFIGNKISLQFKVTECGVTTIESGRKSLLPRPVVSASDNVPIVAKGNNFNPLSYDDAEDGTFNIDDDAGSLKGDDDVTAVAEKVAEVAVTPATDEAVKPKKKIVKVLKK